MKEVKYMVFFVMSFMLIPYLVGALMTWIVGARQWHMPIEVWGIGVSAIVGGLVVVFSCMIAIEYASYKLTKWKS